MLLALATKPQSGVPMIRRTLLLLAMVGIYVAIKRSLQTEVRQNRDRTAEAQWANEGGASAASE